MAAAARNLRCLGKVQRQLCQRRPFTASALCNAAQNFAMPAMSPTMTEGNIASWKVKEGDSYSAGDVLLEIETDKAQMDVEAQEDGILFKITQSDGSKAVKVGARIAVIADAGDDISSLSIPDDDSTSKSKSAKPDESSSQAESEESQNKPKEEASTKDKQFSSSTSSETGSDVRPHSQKYPLYPSVQHLLKQHGLSKEEADKIQATGPNGRLLKGDVLSYVGQIKKDYSAEQSARVKELSHLDLSNIQVAAPKSPSKEDKKTPPKIEDQKDTEVAVPISLAAVIATQKRVRDTLGITLPLSVFIGRASELANEALPLSDKKRGPSADELFDAVLGVDGVHTSPVTKLSRGNYHPSIAVLPAAAPGTARSASRKGGDVLDELIGSQRTKSAARRGQDLPPLVAADGVASSLNVFSVTAPSGEEKRVQAYLERMKLVLEGEPGRLVL